MTHDNRHTATWASPRSLEGYGTSSNGNGSARSQFILNQLLYSRAAYHQGMDDQRRNVNDEAGYPGSGMVDARQLWELYEREPIATRTVEVLPKESWQVQPTVYEEEDSDEATEFEAAWDDLGSYMRPEEGHYADEKDSCVWEYLKRADILSGIGRYGVILLGLDDGADLKEPAKAKDGQELLYLRCFPEYLADITVFESDPKNPRYGQPTRYNITFNDPSQGHQSAGIGLTTATRDVHWSRVIHVADNLGSSEVFGAPRMLPVLNRLLDIRKISAADGEAYWRNAMLKLFFETHPQLGGDVDFDKAGFQDEMEQMMNGLQQWMFLRGMSAKPIAPAVIDPTAHLNAHIEAICIQLGCPVRVFKGSERGELASSQDDAAWNDRLKGRQKTYLTPRVIVPFADRLINLGVLPTPKDGYHVDWPDLTSQTQMEKAQVASAKTGALAQYVSGGVEQLIPPLDYLTRIVGFDEEEAEAILENAEKAMEEQKEEQLLEQEEQMMMQRKAIESGVMADPNKQPVMAVPQQSKGAIVGPSMKGQPPGKPQAGKFPAAKGKPPQFAK